MSGDRGRSMPASVIRRGLVVCGLVFAPAALISSTNAIEIPHSSARVFGAPLLIVSFGLAALAAWRSGTRTPIRRPVWLPAVLVLYLELLALANMLFAAIRPTHARATVSFPFVIAGAAMALTVACTLLFAPRGRRGQQSEKQQGPQTEV